MCALPMDLRRLFELREECNDQSKLQLCVETSACWNALWEYCSESQCQAIVLCSAFTDPNATNGFSRQLCIFAPEPFDITALCQKLSDSSLNLSTVIDPVTLPQTKSVELVQLQARFVLWHQNNTDASRKQVLPMLKEILS